MSARHRTHTAATPKPAHTAGRSGYSEQKSNTLEPEVIPDSIHEITSQPGTPLEPEMRHFFEPRFGHDFSKVRVHKDTRAAESAQTLGAQAYTLKNNIVFGAGRYQPETAEGKRLLAHELVHVVQQENAHSNDQARTYKLSNPGDHSERQAGIALRAISQGKNPVIFSQPGNAIMRESLREMQEFVKAVRESFRYQDEFIKLNGREITDLMTTLHGHKASGHLQALIDNFESATGIHRPRMWVALNAANLKGSTTPDAFAQQFSSDLAGIAEADQRTAVMEFLAAPKPAEAQPETGKEAGAKPAGSETALQATPVTNFKTKSYSMSTAETTIIKKRDKKVTKSKKGKETVTAGREEIKESPEHFTSEILKLAGLDAKSWYSSFTSISFLGFTVSDIHTELATHLKKVEQQFVDKHGGPDKKPEVAGKALGLKQDIGGGRHAPTGTAISMHLFGLAIDVNYDTNPWVAEDGSLKSENEIFNRATLLTDGEKKSFESLKMDYEKISALNQSIKTYFSYIDDKAALEEKLKTATGFWAGKNVDDAQKQVQSDFDALAKHWERKGDKSKGIKEGGFTDLSKELVDGMELDWGGKYGDMMHFDMRNKGLGAKIERARLKYKSQKEKEAETKYSEAHPE